MKRLNSWKEKRKEGRKMTHPVVGNKMTTPIGGFPHKVYPRFKYGVPSHSK